MRSMRRHLLLASTLVVLGAGLCRPAGAQAAESDGKISDGIVKIGLILDMSGIYSDIGGEASATG